MTGPGAVPIKEEWLDDTVRATDGEIPIFLKSNIPQELREVFFVEQEYPMELKKYVKS